MLFIYNNRIFFKVAHEVLSLEILTLLLENPTDDSAEVAITFLKEVGQKLSEVSPRGIHAIFERLRHVLHESTLDKRTQYMIEVMFQVRKDGFKDNPSVAEELDLVEEDDQFTHMITLDDATGGEEVRYDKNIFGKILTGVTDSSVDISDISIQIFSTHIECFAFTVNNVS